MGGLCLSLTLSFSPPASRFVQVLVHLDTTQQEVAAALKDNTVLLAEVGPSGGLGGFGVGEVPILPPCSLPAPLTPTPAGPEDDEGEPGRCRGQLC